MRTDKCASEQLFWWSRPIWKACSVLFASEAQGTETLVMGEKIELRIESRCINTINSWCVVNCSQPRIPIRSNCYEMHCVTEKRRNLALLKLGRKVMFHKRGFEDGSYRTKLWRYRLDSSSSEQGPAASPVNIEVNLVCIRLLASDPYDMDPVVCV